MARTPVLKQPKRANLNFEHALLQAGSRKAENLGISFSDYCSRLIVADLNRKGSAAMKTSRHVRVTRATA